MAIIINRLFKNLLGQKIRNLIKINKLDDNIKILDGQSNIESFTEDRFFS